jgi:PAS domain S-box-containing protein
MERNVRIGRYVMSHTDIVRSIVIVSLTASCIVVTALALSRQVDTIYAQLFYFPILYATYFFPKRGLFLAGFCALTYEFISYVYMYPDTGGLIYTTAQAILFICIAAVVTHFTEKINTSEERYRSIFETSLLGIVLFDQNTFAIRLTNTHLGRMLGYSQEEMTKMTFAQLFFAREDQRRFYEYLGSSEDVINFETRFLTRSGDPLWVNLSWSRIGGNLVTCSVIDIHQRKQAEQEAEENFVQYQQVTEHAPTCIIILRNNRIVYANPSFREFTGYDPAEMTGKDLMPLIHPDDRAIFPTLPETPDSGHPLPTIAELRFVTKNGESRLGTLFFTWITQKGTPAVLINLVDITEHERLKAAVMLDNERRRGIISTVAHELRTPLQPIMGYLNLLMQDPQTYGVTEETRAILDRCAKSVDRESQVINQMLEFSVLDTGKKPLEYSVFSVSGMLSRIIDAGGYTAKAEIVTDVPANLTFDADENKIAIVVDSMLSNAVSYSKPPRKIRISYRFSNADKMHELSVQDNGVGITNSQLDEIFEPFQQPDAASAGKKFDRIGLSLSLAKKYVQLHGGFISVDSIVNLGSTFTIHIPRERPEVKNHGT